MTSNATSVAIPALGVCAVLASLGHAQDKPQPARPQLVVPQLAQVPEVDGRLVDGEWDQAALIRGFIDATGAEGGLMAPDHAQIQIGHREGTLYLAVTVNLPPGVTPSMKFRRRDEPVFLDRYQMEVWLTPPTQGQVKAYQSVINAYGAIWDALHVPALGVVNTGWNGPWTVKSQHTRGERWTAELSLPLSSMLDSPDATLAADGWGLLVAVAWPQRSWPYTQGWYKNVGSHALMTLAADGAGVRMSGITAMRQGEVSAAFMLTGDAKPGEATVTVDGQAFTATAQGQVLQLTGQLPALEDAKLKRTAQVRVADAAGRVLLEGPWTFRVGGDEAPPQDKQNPDAAEGWTLQTRINYAPEANGIRLWGDVLDMPERAALDHAHFAVLPAEGLTPVAESTVRSFEYDAAETLLWLPKNLAPGKYQAISTLRSADGTTLATKRDEFTRPDLQKDFVWLGNTRGKTITLAPPFEAVNVQGKDVSVWGREHRFDGVLPSQITSQGQAMLAAPVTLRAVINGEVVVATSTQPWKLTSQQDTVARFEGGYELAGLALQLTGRLEFDGMVHYDLTATPKNDAAPAIERLYLSIPVKPEHATTYFSTAGGWSASFGIIGPDTPEGRVWTSDAVAPFVPYVGVSDDDRALQWFADTDATWLLGDVPCATIEKAADAIEMQINLVRRPGPIDKPFTAAFGLIASPVRPLPAKWRNTSLDMNPHYGSTVNFFYGPGHGGCPIDPHDTKTLAQVLGVEVGDRDPDAVLAELPPGSRPLDAAAIKTVLGNKADKAQAVQNGMSRGVRHCYFFNAKMYFEGNRSRAFRTFFPGDWQLDPHGGWFHLTPTESYDDFFAFHMDLWFKHWIISGMYFDETYFAPDYNVFNGNGHAMPDGSVRPTVALMRQRANMQRMRQLFIDNDREPFIWVHSSNFMAPHAISAVDVAMFGEDRMPTPASDYVDTTPAALMRSIGRAQKFGFVPVWMDQAGRGGQHQFSRQVWGWCWMHDVVPEYHTSAYQLPALGLRVAWGIDQDDVTFIPYWHQDTGIRTSTPDLIVSAWKRGDGSMLLQAMNLAKSTGTASQVMLDATALGLPAQAKVYDLESAASYRTYTEALMAELLKPRSDQDAAKLRELLSQAKSEQPWLDAADVKGLREAGSPASFNVEVPARDWRLYVVK